MTKRILILRDARTRVAVTDTHVQIKNITGSYVVAFVHLEKIFLNKAIDIDIGACYAICRKVPLYLIDQNGYILAELQRSPDAPA